MCSFLHKVYIYIDFLPESINIYHTVKKQKDEEYLIISLTFSVAHINITLLQIMIITSRILT